MKKICNYNYLLLFLIFLSPLSFAEDGRIKIVSYNPSNIITIIGNHFISTAIYFGIQETILHVDIGDSLAWKVAPVSAEAPNVLFIMPQLPQSDTNMTIITNKHNYLFHLIVDSKHSDDQKNITYALRFNYPEEEKAQLQNQMTIFQRIFARNETHETYQWNENYSFYRNQGRGKIAPIQALDNGKFTLFKFRKEVSMPAIFTVDGNQNEALINFSTQGDFILIQGVHRQYTLRSGDEVVTVYNDHSLEIDHEK